MHTDLEQYQKTRRAFILAAGLSLAFFLASQILLTCGLLQSRISGMPSTGNLTAYILTLVLFVIAFSIFFFILRNTQTKMLERILEHPVSSKEFTATFTIGSAVLLILLADRRMIAEITEFAVSSRQSFHQFPTWLGIILFVAMSTFAVVLGLLMSKNRLTAQLTLFSNHNAYICSAGILLLNFVCTLVMNIFYADIHHGVAYIESIYNVYYGVPYTHITSGIYGYYGLFLAPILHLFNGSNFALMVTISLLQCLVTGLCFYCIHALTENNLVRIMALLMCSLSTLSMRISNYWQVQPHRVLWPLILTAFVIHLVKKGTWCRAEKVFGYCLCTAAVLWNIESGLFCSIAFAAACIIHNWQQRVWYAPKSLLNAVLHIACVIATVFVAIVIVNGCNYAFGWRELFLKDFFFPMFETSYMSGFLEVDMPVGNHAWVYVLALFGGLLLWSLYMTSFVHGKAISSNIETAKIAPAMIAVAILGLCNFSYYANRAAYFNLDIIVQLAGIAVCMLWSNMQKSVSRHNGSRVDCGKAIISYVSLVLIIVLSLEAVLFSVPQLYRKIKRYHYNTKNYKEACMMLQNAVPEDTFAFGGGISMMYADLGWDTIGHYRDMSDLSVGGSTVADTIMKDVLQQDAFVVYLSTGNEAGILQQILLAEPAFVLTEESELNGITMQYYVRTDR